MLSVGSAAGHGRSWTDNGGVESPFKFRELEVLRMIVSKRQYRRDELPVTIGGSRYPSRGPRSPGSPRPKIVLTSTPA